MKTKTLIIGAIAMTAVVVGGLAVAQSIGPGPRHFGPQFTEAEGPGAMGPGHRMGPGMSPSMMQKGPGMMHQKGPEMGHRMMQKDPGLALADPNAVTRMTPQDRYAFVTKMRERANKQFNTVKTATDELVTTLDDAQKAKARSQHLHQNH